MPPIEYVECPLCDGHGDFLMCPRCCGTCVVPFTTLTESEYQIISGRHSH